MMIKYKKKARKNDDDVDDDDDSGSGDGDYNKKTPHGNFSRGVMSHLGQSLRKSSNRGRPFSNQTHFRTRASQRSVELRAVTFENGVPRRKNRAKIQRSSI